MVHRNRNKELRDVAEEIQDICPDLSDIAQALAGVYLYPDIEGEVNSDGSITLDGMAEHLNVGLHDKSQAFGIAQQAKDLAETCANVPHSLSALIFEAFTDLQRKEAFSIAFQLIREMQDNPQAEKYLRFVLAVGNDASLAEIARLSTRLNQAQEEEFTQPEWINYSVLKKTTIKDAEKHQVLFVKTLAIVMKKAGLA